MISYEDLYKKVKEKLSSKRFKHSEGVVKRAIEYAEVYNVDIEKIKKIAIAHDIAKELTEEDKTFYIKKYKINLDEIEKINKELIHAKIGSEICKNEFDFTDEMSDGIRYHTTGRENMSMIEKIIYLADATEENRKYDYDYYVELTKKDINQSILEISAWTIDNLLKNNNLIHPDSIKCYNYYTMIKGKKH